MHINLDEMKGIVDNDFRTIDPAIEFYYNPRETKGGSIMGKYIAVLGGLAAMAGGLALVVFVPKFWLVFSQLVLGFVPPILFFGGLIGLIAGISSIKDAKRTKKLEQETEAKKEKA